MARYTSRVVDIPLVRGAQQDADIKLTEPRLQTVENYDFQKQRRLSKRGRFTSYTLNDLSGSALSGSTRMIAERDGNIVYTTTERIYELSQNAARCSEHGPFPDFGRPQRTVVAREGSKNISAYAAVFSGNYYVYAWIVDASGTANGEGELWTSVHSFEGIELFRQKLSSNARRPRLLERAAGSAVILWWLDGAASPYTLKYTQLTTSSVPSSWGGTTSFTTAIVVGHFDAAAFTSTGISFVAYYDGTQLVIKRLDTSITTTHTVNVVETATDAIGLETDGTNVAVGWSTTTNTRAAIYTHATLAAVVAPLTLFAGKSQTVNWAVKFGDATTWVWVAGRNVTATMTNVDSTVFGRLTTGGAPGTDETVYHCIPISRPGFFSHAYMTVVLAYYGYSNVFERSAYIVRYSALSASAYGVKPVAVLLTGGLADLGQDITNAYLTPNALTNMANGYLFAWGEVYRYTSLAVTGTGNIYAYGLSGISSWRVPRDDQANNDFQTTSLERCTYFSGGIVCQYDGNTASEVGWTWSPSYATATTSGTGNTWNYVFTYAWYDKQGKLHESMPGSPVKVTNVNSATFTVQTMTLTFRQDVTLTNRQSISIRQYRTLNGGTTYRFIQEVKNRTDVDAIVFPADNNSDSTISGNPTLYTDQRLLPCGQPIAANDLCTWDNRVVACNNERIYLSTRASEANGPCFIDDATHWVESHSGTSTVAVEQQDDALVIFNEKEVLLVQGDGPEQSGQPVLPTPRKIQGAQGCTRARSVLVTPVGIVYQSLRGLELLPRGFGGVQWLGADIQDFLAVFNDIRGSCADIKHSRAVWICTDNDVNVSLIVWDWDKNAWADYAVPHLAQVGDLPYNVLWSGPTAFNGIVFPIEGPILYVPTGTAAEFSAHLVSTLETNKIYLAGMTGEARLAKVRVLGELADTSARITMSLGYDDGAYGPSKTWDITGSVGDPIQLEMVPSRMKLRSIRIKLVDGAYNGTTANAGFVLNALSLTIAEHKAVQPLQAARRG